MGKEKILKSLLIINRIVIFIAILAFLFSLSEPLFISIDPVSYKATSSSPFPHSNIVFIATFVIILILNLVISVFKRHIKEIKGPKIQEVLHTEPNNNFKSTAKLLGHVFLLIFFGFTGLFGLAQATSPLQLIGGVLVFGLILFVVAQSLIKR